VRRWHSLAVPVASLVSVALVALALASAVSAPAAPPATGRLPDIELPPDALLLREVIDPGPERTGNWREMFRSDGCYFLARNTWMWVGDRVLLSSPAPEAHFNAPFPGDPWFCLAPAQLADLGEALRRSRFEGAGREPAGPVLRWTAVQRGAIGVAVVPLGRHDPALAPVEEALARLAAEGVWAQSPERTGAHRAG
jgi:hypothetical protein